MPLYDVQNVAFLTQETPGLYFPLFAREPWYFQGTPYVKPLSLHLALSMKGMRIALRLQERVTSPFTNSKAERGAEQKEDRKIYFKPYTHLYTLQKKK